MLDIGEGADGELQAVGQIGAVAKAQGDPPTHDVVGEPFQGALIHAVIMTDKSGNVELLCPFLSICCMESGIYFLGTPARSARTWVMVSQNSSSTFSLDRPTTSTFGTPAVPGAPPWPRAVAASDKPVWDVAAGNRTISMARLTVSHHCEADHCRKCFCIIDLITGCFLALLTHRATLRRRTLVTEPHVGYSGKQIAHAVSLDTNHGNAFVTDAVENFCPPCGHRAQEA